MLHWALVFCLWSSGFGSWSLWSLWSLGLSLWCLGLGGLVLDVWPLAVGPQSFVLGLWLVLVAVRAVVGRLMGVELPLAKLCASPFSKNQNESSCLMLYLCLENMCFHMGGFHDTMGCVLSNFKNALRRIQIYMCKLRNLSVCLEPPRRREYLYIYIYIYFCFFVLFFCAWTFAWVSACMAPKSRRNCILGFINPQDWFMRLL